MSESTGADGGSGEAETDDHVHTTEALSEILSNEADGRYLLLGLGAAGLWWLVLDPISAFTAALGFIVLVFVADSVVETVMTRGWPTTEAVVLESKVLTRREAGKRAGTFTGDQSLSEYVPLVRYEYTVDGTTHENARVSPFDASTSRRGWVETLVDGYPDRSYVDVRYDPDDPTRSYLQSWTLASRVNVFVPIALFFLTLAVVIAIGVNTDARAPAGLVPIVMGLPFVLLGLYRLRTAIGSSRWPTTTGTVTGSNIRAHAGTEGSSGGYSIEIIYEYDVDGDTYTSRRYSFGDRPTKSTRSAAETWLEEHYPVGSDTTVYYDPDDPDVTVLETGGAGTQFVIFLVGLVFTGIGVVILLQPDLVVPPVVEGWIDRFVG
jgi:hypothetical protein